LRFKFDENLDPRLIPLLEAEGHEVDTVPDEQLSGKPDTVIYQAAMSTGRTLITLDLDFSNPLRFPTGETEGIIVIRPPRPVFPLIRTTLKSVLPQLRVDNPRENLWIVEPGRIRKHRGK